jgi:hypothetical protein
MLIVEGIMNYIGYCKIFSGIILDTFPEIDLKKVHELWKTPGYLS